MKTAATLIALAGVAGFASAQVVEVTGGAGGSISDVLGPTSSSIVVTDDFVIEDFDLNLNGLQHTWVGDLNITITNEDTGVSVTVTDRPGNPASTFGFNVDLDGDYTFDDDAGTSFEAATGAAVGAGFLGGGSYGPENALSAFNGTSTAGTWTLTITDNAGGDDGFLGDWGATITIPTPGALAVAGLGGLVATRRRRA